MHEWVKRADIDSGKRAGISTDIAEKLKALDRYISRLARFLASVVNLIDPDVIVLGGGMSHVTPLYARLPAAMRPYTKGH